MEPNFFLNGQANGSVAQLLLNNNMDPNVLRPWIGKDGRSYRAQQNGLDPKTGAPLFKAVVHNAPATLRKDEWILLDSAIIRASRVPLRLWADLRGANSYNVPNGMGTIVIQQQSVSDNGVATISMDGLRQSERDRPVYDITGIPLPIIHSDFSFTAREIAVSRNGGPPLDTTMAENCTRRVMEQIETLTAGGPAFSYAGYSIFGYTTYPQRITYSVTAPTSTGWTGETFIDDLLNMRQALINVRFFGPYQVYISSQWNPYLDADYSTAKGTITLRERAEAIDGITSIDVSFFLTGWSILMIQMTSDVAQAVVGMDVRTLQWESHGGMVLNFKVMAIMVPRLKANQQGQTGICHGS